MADPVLDKPRGPGGEADITPKLSVKASTAAAPSPDLTAEQSFARGDAPPPITLHTVSPGAPTFRIVTHPDESLRGVMTTPDFQTTDTGRVNIDPKDARALLHAQGQYDDTTDSWTVDEKTFTALQQGRPNFAENTVKKWEGGEIGLVKNGLSLKFLAGEMTPAEYNARIHEEDLKNQLGQQPALAYRGLGAYAAGIIAHPAEAAARVAKFALDSTMHPIDTAKAEAGFVADAVRFIVGETAEQGPLAREALKAQAEGAVKGAAAGAVATMAMPVLAAGAVPLGAEIGAMHGSLNYFVMQETGSSVEDLHKKGFDMATIRKVAPIAGVIKGTLEMASFGVMTAPFKTALVKNVLTSKPVVAAMTAAANTFMKSGAGVLAETVAAEVTTEEMQTTTDILANNYAAAVENKPNARINFPEMVDQWVETAAKTFGASLGFGALGAGVTAASNRVATRAETKLQAETTARIAKDAAVIAPVEGAAGAAVQSAQTAPETLAPTTSASPPEVVSESRNPTKYKASADSMAGHPAFVKASEEATKAGVDPADFSAVVDLYDKANNQVHALRMKYGIGPGMKLTEAFHALSEAEKETVASEIADSAMKRIQTEPLAYLLVTGKEYLFIANKNLGIDPAAAAAWETSQAPTSPESLVAAWEAGDITAEDLLAGVAQEEKPAAEPAKSVAPADKKTLAQQTHDVAVEAAITAKESDLREVNTLLKEATAERARALKAGEATGRRDQKINALLDEKEGLLADIADLKTPVIPAVPRPTTLELKAATLEDIVAAGFKEGGNQAKERAKIVKAIASENKLTDADVKGLLKNKNLGLLGETAFNNFVETFKADVAALGELKTARKELAVVLKEKAIINESRLRKIRDLPISRKMTVEQLRQYAEVLKGYEKNDEILTAKRVEALKVGKLAGVDTMRGIREKAAEFLKKPLAALAGAKVTEWSVFTPDTQLAATHPFFDYMVRRAKDARREAIALTLAFKDVNNKLAAAAIASRARLSIGERFRSWFLPQQKAVAAYIESQAGPTIERAEAAKALTPEELAWADAWTDFAARVYEHLLQTQALTSSAHKGAYIPHVRRPLREMIAGIKDDGVRSFFREFKQRFETLDADVSAVDTENKPLGLQKFLKNTLHRTDRLKPSLNLVPVMNDYAAKIFQKVAVDKLVSEIDSLALALKSEDTSIGAAESNKALKKFTDAFLNAKKGNAPWAFQQGGAIETLQRFGTNMASLSYISLNFALQLASPVGATIVEIPVLGNKGVLLAKKRRLSAQGRAILAMTEHRAFTGESLKEIVMDPGKTLPEQVSAVANGMWSIIHHEVMSDLLLGSMTDEEFAAGKISQDRLTDIEVKAGRWIDVRGSKSIRGSSVTGAGWTQFKGWMIPPMRTTAENALALADMLAHPTNKEKRITPAQALEIAYIAEMTAIGLLARAALGKDDPDDDSFLEKFRHYLRGELFTHVQALNIATFAAAPPGIAWLTRLGHNLLLLADLDEDKRARGKKGLIKQAPFASIVRPALEEKK